MIVKNKNTKANREFWDHVERVSAKVELNKYTQDEWWDFARVLKPDMTKEEFGEKWQRFIEEKERRNRCHI